MGEFNKIRIVDFNNIWLDQYGNYKDIFKRKKYIIIKKNKCIKYYIDKFFLYNNFIIDTINLKNIYEYEDFFKINKFINNSNSNNILIFVVKITNKEEFNKIFSVIKSFFYEKDLVIIAYASLNYVNLLKNTKKNIFFIKDKDDKELVNLSIDCTLKIIIKLIIDKRQIYNSLKSKDILNIYTIKIKDENSIGRAVIKVLNEFKEFQYCNEFIIGIFIKDYLKVQDFSYFIDPLEEYMPFDAKINFVKIYDENINELFIINIIGAKKY